MAEKVLMIALSPTMESGTILKWRKQEGDFVESGDVLCEVETDKATMEYESTADGTLLKILRQEGEEARIEEPIAVLGEKGEDITALLRDIAESVPEKSEKHAQAESSQKEDISTQSKESPQETVSAFERTSSPDESRLMENSQAVVQGLQPAIPSDHMKTSPLARQLAQQHGFNLERIRGSGPEGRIIKRDIEKAIEISAGEPERQARTLAPPETEEVALSGKRKVIAQRISESKFSAPHYYLRTVVAMDILMAARSELNRGRDEKVSLNAFIIKFVAEALKRHRNVNAGWGGDKIILFGRADIGLAVAQQDGLITPIVRDCWNKGIIQIDREIRPLIEKALNNRLKVEEYTGATFTISNLGSFGILEFTAIINPPGSAILAVGQIRKEPVVEEDEQIRIHSNMTLTLSCDHRVFDGAEGALFLKDLKILMENPVQVLY